MTASESVHSHVYRIGIDARMYRGDSGGIGRYTRHLLTSLAEIDRVNHYSVFLTPADFAEWTITAPNFQPIVVDIPHYSYAEQLDFLRKLYAEKLDLMHFLNFNHPILYRKPFITTLHDLTVYFHPVGRSQKSRIRRIGFVQSLRHAARAAKKVITISEYTAQDVARHLGVSQAAIEVIYEGSPAVVELPFGNKAMVQEYLGTREPYFLFISQWRPHKGILTLIEAFSQFKATTGLPHKLVLVGKQQVLAQQVKDALVTSPVSSDILMPGFVPDEMLFCMLRNCASFIFPSEYEGFGLPILEAYRFGAPAIVADNSSIPEVAGNGALYFPTGDAAALADRMRQVVATPGLVDELAKGGASQLKKFSWDKMAEQTLAVYLNVLEKHASSGMVSDVPRWRNW